METENKKRHIGLWIFLGVLVLAILCIVLYYRYFGAAAFVQPVEYMNNSWMLEQQGGEGRISDSATQNEFEDYTAEIVEVFVKEGDAVKTGDPLYRLNTEQLELALEEAKLSLEAANNRLSMEKQRLKSYEAIVPVEKKPEEIPPEPEPVPEWAPSAEQTLPAPYAGDGSEEAPFQYLCREATLISAEQINTWIGEGSVAELELRENDSQEGELLDSWIIDGRSFIEMPAGTWYSVAGRNEYIPEIPEPAPAPEPEPEEPVVTYTKEEKDKKVTDQKLVIARAENTARTAQAALTAAEQRLSNATVTAKMDGVVQKVGDPENIDSTQPFVTVANENGLTLTGYVSELLLSETKVGDKLSVSSWESGTVSDATITEISQFPDPNAEQWTDGNGNVSWYPYTAIMEDADGFYTGEMVSVTPEKEIPGDAIVIMKIYVRSEQGENYVLVDNGNGRLAKKTVKVESAPDNQYYIVTEGLSNEDMIAFPYGSKAVEGMRTTDQMSIFDIF